MNSSSIKKEFVIGSAVAVGVALFAYWATRPAAKETENLAVSTAQPQEKFVSKVEPHQHKEAYIGKKEITMVMIRPDAIQRNRVGEIIGTFEKRGFKILGMKMFTMDDQMKGRSSLFGPIAQGKGVQPFVALVVQGQSVTKTALKILGIANPADKNPNEKPPGTLIGNNNLANGRAMVAASPSPKITAALYPVIFKEGLLKFDDHSDKWVYEN